MSWANTYLNDRHKPSMSSTRPADKDWTDDTTAPTHDLGSVTAQDSGLGIGQIALTGAANGTKTATDSCTGDPQRAPCPLNWPTTLPGYNLDEGVNVLTLTPTDIVDNVGAGQTWTEKIDRSAPMVDLPTVPDGDEQDGRILEVPDGVYAAVNETEYTLTFSAEDAYAGVGSVKLIAPNGTTVTRWRLRAPPNAHASLLRRCAGPR